MATESLYGIVAIAEATLGFSNLIAPISAMSYITDNSKYNVGDSVLVPFAAPNSASNNFTYAAGYGTGVSTTLGSRAVILNNVAYQRFVINDADHSKLDATSFSTFARQAGERLAT